MLRVDIADPGHEDSGFTDFGIDTELERALTDLPVGQVAAVNARVVDDLSYENVAERLDCTPIAARIRVSRGLDALRTTLEDT